VIVDWTDEFDRWLTNAGEQGGKLLEDAVALLQALNDPGQTGRGIPHIQASQAGPPP
jgi:hypothetical protein